MHPEKQLQTSWSEMLKVALPVCLGVFVQFIVMIIDNYFVAQIDGNAMSAASFVALIYLTLVMIGLGLSNATQIIVARRKGENRIDDAGSVVGNAFWMSIVVATIQFALLYFLLPVIIERSIESKQVSEYMNVFTQYRAFGFFFYTLTLVFNAFWAGVARTRIMIYTTVLTAFVNIILDYGLVFGNLGMPEMGMAGAALATTIAEACAFFFLLWFTFRYHDHKTLPNQIASGNIASYKLRHWIITMPKRHSITLIKLGGPIAMQMLGALGIWVIFYKFVESMGEQPLQSSFIVRNMYMLVYVSVAGFTTTISTYVSGLIAEKRQSELLPVIRKLILMNMCGVIILSHGLWLYPEWIVSLFSDDPIIMFETVRTMHIVLPAMLVFSVTSMLLGTVEGSGSTVAGFTIELATVIIYIVTAYVMVYVWKWPIHLVWTADYVYFLSLGVFSLFFLWNGKWKFKKI